MSCGAHYHFPTLPYLLRLYLLIDTPVIEIKQQVYLQENVPDYE